MKSRELRIGNFYSDINDEITELSGYELYEMTVKENQDNLGVSEFKPIPLTEEWLLRLGFTKGLFTLQINVKEQFIEYKDGEVFLGGEDSCISEMCFKARITTVHQLQNLYFALTGEELLINKS